MTRFLLISLLSVTLFSCSSYKIDAAKKENSITEFKNPYFENPQTDYVYKAHIEVYGNKLGGIFITKRISDSVHRVVFTTEFGNKLMDFELSENDFKVNYIIDDLNRKIILNTLEKDFRILLKINHKSEEIFENNNFLIYKTKNGKNFDYFFFNKAENKLSRLVHASKSSEKVVFDFVSKNTTFAEGIIISHKNIKLKIELNQIIN
ncbi:hypothetical protein [Flavobacterium sp. H122]|uniref:hypothetical protein n=1 Tax=Flavobacterium sp. H122 TaxID=2529860 RepID=UPI0020C0BEDC|nr:hypothetical protein [Flavobacterium sp. H122]